MEEFKKIRNSSGEMALYGKDVTDTVSGRVHYYMHYYMGTKHVSYLCVPKFAFGEKDTKLHMEEYVSVIGGFLMFPDLYNTEQTEKHSAILKKRAAKVVMCAAQNKMYEFIRAYFRGGYTLAASTFEMLLEEVKEDVEMHSFVLEQFHRAYDIEKLKKQKEAHAIRLIEHPDMAGNYRDRFTWSVLSDEEVRINKVLKPENPMVYIPAKIGKRDVVALKWEACAALNIKSVIIPKTVRDIGDACFRDSAVESVVLPEGLYSINTRTFDGCKNLKEIALPSSIRHIEFGAFACSGIQSIVLPEGLNEIDDRAFQGCRNLKEITLPMSVQHIGHGAFSSSGIKSIVFSEGLKFIGSDVFRNCQSLKEVVLPSSVRKIGAGAFGYTGIESITLPEGLEKISASMFAGCKSLKEITLPASVRHIGDCCFGKSGLESIVLPEGVEDIGYGAFDGCSDLKSITIPDTVKEIGSCVFESCDALETIFVIGDPDKVKKTLEKNNSWLSGNWPVKILKA